MLDPICNMQHITLSSGGWGYLDIPPRGITKFIAKPLSEDMYYDWDHELCQQQPLCLHDYMW